MRGIRIGCAWYPEQWDEARWVEDLRLMQAAHLNMVRVAEFAWSALEPEEGVYTLDWLERAVTLAGEYGMACVIGTPTASPPAWLTQHYPETLAVSIDGKRAEHGGRCHYSAASAVYRRFCKQIVTAMSERFGQHPNVIAWQIDNEYLTISYDDETRAAFQVWLQAQYGSLRGLNTAWTTRYWSQEYSDWSQIPFTLQGNPGLMLAARRFITQVYVDYQREQIDAIDACASPQQEIYHNLIAWHDGFDYYQISKDLDFVGWNQYIPIGHLDYLTSGAMHDLMRGMKQRAFWMSELQPGRVNWSHINTELDRGETARVAWHAIAHGADGLSYWQWRSALNGQEQYHGTLIAQDGTPRPIYIEIAELAKQIRKIGDVMDGTQPRSECAMLHSYEDRWIINQQRHHQDFNPVDHWLRYYRPLFTYTQSVDVLPVEADLHDYKLVVAPSLHLLTDESALRLLNYVYSGGHLLLGPRSGMKDKHNALHPMRQPGVLAEALGAYVEEYYALAEPVTTSGILGNGSASIWAEWLHVTALDADVLLRYGAHSWLDGQPAIVSRRVKKGRITLVGAWLDDGLMVTLMEWACREILPIFGSLPRGIEVGRRVGNGRVLYVVINHTDKQQSVPLREIYLNLLDGQQYVGALEISAQGIVLLTPT